MKLSSVLLSAGMACLMATAARAAVTPYSWIRAGEANNVFADSSGTAHPFNAAFSSGCMGGAGGGGNPAAVIVGTGAGGPLGPSGISSSSSTRWGSFGCPNSGMWIQGPNNSVPPPAQWSLPAINWVMECWVLPVGDARAGGSSSDAQFMSTGSGQFGGTPGGAAFRTTFNFADGTISIRADSIGRQPSENFTIGNPVVTDTAHWIHVAVVNDNGVTTFYANGVAQGASSTQVTAPSGVPYIGSGQDTGAAFDGYLDECRYSTFAPGQFQISDLLTRPAGPSIISQPQSATVWQGGAAPFSVQAAIDADLTYQWRRDGTEIPDALGPELFLDSVDLDQSGSVFSVLLNSGGIDRASSNATLTVVPVQTANVDFYRTAVLAEGSIEAFFPVDGDVEDLLSNVVDGGHQGTVSYLAGYDGRTNRAFGERALRFIGSNDVTVPNNPAYEFTDGDGTIEALIYLAAVPGTGNGTIFALATSPADAYLQFQASLDGSALVYKNSALAQALSWPVPVSLVGRLAHVALVFSDNTVTAYLDGLSLGTKAHAGFGLAPGLQANLGSSGRVSDAIQDPWIGTLDELAIYGEALSANTIAVHNSKFVYGTNVTAPTIQSQPSGAKSLLAGGVPIFRVRASGTAPLLYQWSRNGVAILDNPSAQTSDLILDPSTVAQSGDYTVEVSNPIGEVTSTPFTVNFTAPSDTYADYVLADRPSAYWRLNETNGATLKDSAGGLDGTYSTTVDRGVGGAPGVTDLAAHFSGSSTPVANAIVPFSPTLNPTGPFTIEFWVRPDQSGQNSRAVIGNQNRNTGRAGYAIYQGFNGNFWEAHLGFGETVLFIQGLTPPAASRWDHIAVTWDGVSIARLFVNGRDDTNPGSTTGGPHRPNLSVPFEIASRFGNGIPYPGTIDEIAFYNHQLTPEQIEKHWSASWVPPVVIKQPTSVTNGIEASTITLTAQVTGYPNTYQWYKDNVALIPYNNPDGTPHFPQGVTSTTLVITQVTPADTGIYYLIADNPLDDSVTAEAFVQVTEDTSPPAVALVTADSSLSRVRVKFNRPVTPETASIPENYNLGGDVSATAVVLTTDPSLVDVVTTGLTPGTQYTLVVSGVKDQRILHNEIGTNSTRFHSYVLTPGVLALDYYERIPGTLVTDLQNSPRFPNGVYTNGMLTNFSTLPLTGGDLNSRPAFGSMNLGSDYGVRLYGWISPTADGDYTFFLRSDDASELRLSPGANPADAVLIAYEAGCCDPFKEPGAGVTETSTPQTLFAGESYYIEVLNKEGIGGDYVEVAWRDANDARPAGSLTPIPGAFLSAYAPLPTPRFVAITDANGQITITWTGVGVLQESADLVTWQDVPGNPGSGYMVTPLPGTHKLYRLLQ